MSLSIFDVRACDTITREQFVIVAVSINFTALPRFAVEPAPEPDDNNPFGSVSLSASRKPRWYAPGRLDFNVPGVDVSGISDSAESIAAHMRQQAIDLIPRFVDDFDRNPAELGARYLDSAIPGLRGTLTSIVIEFDGKLVDKWFDRGRLIAAGDMGSLPPPVDHTGAMSARDSDGSPISLGDAYRDTVTGAEGVATGISFYLNSDSPLVRFEWPGDFDSFRKADWPWLPCQRLMPVEA